MAGPMIEPFSIHEIDHHTGGRIALCRLPGRAGELTDDVARLAAWRPALVLSLTERAEAEAYGAGALGDRLAAHGIPHLWFPIRDFGVPEADDAQWPALAAKLHGYLDRGDGVLIHCLGGKGRSGMIAMRLMIERGFAPAEALIRVRAARTGAVETPEQEAWGAIPATLGGRHRR